MEVIRAWLETFERPLPFEPADWLDGEAREFLPGWAFREIVSMGQTPMADTPLLR